jgi:hypothetical protein
MVEADFPECTSFGSVIRFALELEKVSAAVYDELADKQCLASAHDAFKALSAAHKKRSGILEHTRREKLNEMILEPIQDMDSSKYVLDAKVPEPIDIAGAKAFASKMEATSASFYSDASKVAKMLMAEAARILDKMGKECEANRVKLEAL